MEARYMTDLEWRICHAVNIYVFKNGNDQQTPILVHIPPSRKKTMQSVMDTVQERVTYPVGYAKTLYTMDGRRIRHPCELEMYNNYVVASNFEKAFKCVEYGRKRSPLLILNRYSKHIRVLRLQNDNYDQWLRKKREMGSERPQYIYPERYIHEGVLPQDLPVDRMGNTYVPNCDVDPNAPDYAEKHGMRKIPTRNNQQKNYTVNAFTVEQDPIEEYLQHAESNEVQEQNSAKSKTSGRKEQNSKPEKTSGREEQIPPKQFKALGQDQVFYQPQKKWRTKGVLDKNKDEHFPLFPTASDTLNANVSHVNEDDVEDIASPEEDECNVVEVIDELDGNDNPPIETVHKPANSIIPKENEKKNISYIKKTQKKTGNSKKRIHSEQSNDEDNCNNIEITELDENYNKNPLSDLNKPTKNSTPINSEKAIYFPQKTIKKPGNSKKIIRSKQSTSDDNCNDVEVTEESDEKYESNSPVIVTVSVPAKKSTPSKKEKVVTFSQKKTVRKIGQIRKIIHSAESNEVQEEQTKQFTPLVQDQVFYQPKLWISSEGPQYVYPERYMHQGILLQDLPVDHMGNTFVPHCDMHATPHTTEYIKINGMCNAQPRPNQPSHFPNAMAADHCPPKEYMHMQHAPNEMQEQYPKHYVVVGQDPQRFRIEQNTKQFTTLGHGHEEQLAQQFKTIGQQEQVTKQFQTLEQDQMFYQSQGKWRTNGNLENSKDLPLFPRASEMLIAKSSTEYEEDIEDITDPNADNGNDVEEDIDEEDYDSNTVTVTVKMHEKKGTPNKKEKVISLSQKKAAKCIDSSPYDITRSPKGSTMREKCTQTDRD